MSMAPIACIAEPRGAYAYDTYSMSWKYAPLSTKPKKLPSVFIEIFVGDSDVEKSDTPVSQLEPDLYQKSILSKDSEAITRVPSPERAISVYVCPYHGTEPESEA